MRPTVASGWSESRFSLARTRPQDLNLTRREVEALRDVDLVLRPEEVQVEVLRQQAERYRTLGSRADSLLPPPPGGIRPPAAAARNMERARPQLEAIARRDGPDGRAAARLLEAFQEYGRMMSSLEAGRARGRE